MRLTDIVAHQLRKTDLRAITQTDITTVQEIAKLLINFENINADDLAIIKAMQEKGADQYINITREHTEEAKEESVY